MRRFAAVILLCLLAIPLPADVFQYPSTGGNNAVAAGAGSGTVTLGGTLCKGAPNLATVGTGEEVLATCTLPANTLNADGAKLEYSFAYAVAGNANSKTARVRLGGAGGDIVHAHNTATGTHVFIIGDGVLTRFSSTLQHGNANSLASADDAFGTGSVGTSNTTATQTLTSASSLVFACQSAVGGECTLKSYTVAVVQ